MSTKSLGAWMIAMGFFAILINFVGLQFRILWFMDEFGNTVGHLMKGGLIVLGVLILKYGDRDTAESYEEPGAGGKKAWVHIAVALVVIVGIAVFALARMVKDSRVEQQVKREPQPAAWVRQPATNWPALVLHQQAEFKSHTSMSAGCACLVRLPGGEIALLTAGHLLGKPGGVRPGFLSPPFGALDREKLATLDREILSWKAYVSGRNDQFVQVSGLITKANYFPEDGDQLLLRLSAGPSPYSVTPLDLRVKPVAFGEPLNVVLPESTETSHGQNVHKAKRIPGMFLTCELAEPAELDGCSGAPVLDQSGLLVGIVTGGTVLAKMNTSARLQGFSAHGVSELMPVLKAALAEAPSVARARTARP